VTAGKDHGVGGGTGGQDEVIAFLSDPASYGEPPDAVVERIETHGAIVFLTGERAWKLKKAVHFSYMDFSTIEKRRQVCEAELALNARASPELYLEVRSVNRQADGALGFGPGAPVDWLVVMRRFADADLLCHVAERGALDADLCRRLADRVAAFHEGIARVRPASGAALIEHVVTGNEEAMAALPEGLLPGADCRRLHDVSQAALDRIAPLLDARAREGHVARGHGDLHLANICLWQGEPLLFDCLEFDEALATVDLLYDLAFLLMDLIERGFTEQANWVFNRYLDRRDESSALAALPLFLSLRAGVRAHVEALRDGAAGRAYLAAALAFLAPAPPRLVAVGGLSGTGKSTLARALAPGLGAPPGARLLRTDVLRKRLAGAAPEQRLPESAYTPASHAAVYAQLRAQARAALAAGCPVIVDAVFDDSETRADMAALARDCGVPFAGLWLEAPRETLIARVSARQGDASDAGAAVVDKQLGRDIGPLGDWHRIDAGGGADTTVTAARAILAQAVPA
jgi:aminoglycoside phosphotransferase family enzyme/predicted kinase